MLQSFFLLLKLYCIYSYYIYIISKTMKKLLFIRMFLLERFIYFLSYILKKRLYLGLYPITENFLSEF